MNFVGKNKNNNDMKETYRTINNLIKEEKLKFGFYNSYKELELLQLCHNKVNNTIEFEFRDIMAEYLDEIKNIRNKLE